MVVFELNRIVLETLRYPSRKTWISELGLFSTFEKAYEMLQEIVAEAKEDEEECEKEGEPDDTLGYVINKILLDAPYGCTVAFRTYTHDGEFNDENAWTDEKGKVLPFYGRPEEKIRFKMGDIVEVYMGKYDAELSIIDACPWTPQKIEKRNKELEQKYGKGHTLILDSSDDRYMTNSL